MYICVCVCICIYLYVCVYVLCLNECMTVGECMCLYKM